MVATMLPPPDLLVEANLGGGQPLAASGYVSPGLEHRRYRALWQKLAGGQIAAGS